MFRKTAIVFATLSLLAPSAVWAADTQQQQSAPLAPGSSAGVKQAQMFSGTNTAFMVGSVLVVTAAVLAITANGGGHTTTTSTPSTH